MRLDYQILLKFPPLKLLVGSTPALGSLARTIAVAKPCRIIVVCIFAWRVIKAVFAAKITRFWRHYVELGEIVLCAVSAWRLTQCFRRSVRIRCRSSAEIVNVAKCSFEFFFSHRKVKVAQKHISHDVNQTIYSRKLLFRCSARSSILKLQFQCMGVENLAVTHVFKNMFL